MCDAMEPSMYWIGCCCSCDLATYREREREREKRRGRRRGRRESALVGSEDEELRTEE
jgi:hypothetical protein